MVTEVVMRVWIRLVQGSEKVKDQDVDEAHGKSEGVYIDLIKKTFLSLYNCFYEIKNNNTQPMSTKLLQSY